MKLNKPNLDKAYLGALYFALMLYTFVRIVNQN